jgi:hypothetical protein
MEVFQASQQLHGQRLLLLLQSRCLSVTAKSFALLLQHLADLRSATEQQTGIAKADAAVASIVEAESVQLHTMAAVLRTAVGECTAGISDAGLQLQGEAAAVAKVRKELQQQGKALVEQLQPYVEQDKDHRQQQRQTVGTEQEAPSGDSRQDIEQHQQRQKEQQQRGLSGQQAQQLAQDLQQFGDAICLQLPVSSWCCNPRCSSVEEHSELELVSRKGSRCSGRAAARFCSKACQQQCSKGQHAPVCKRIAAVHKGSST